MSAAPLPALSAESTAVRRRSAGRIGPISRRRFLASAIGSAALLAISSCGDDTRSGPSIDPPGPQRVVAIGQGVDADALIALGIVPVGMSAGYNVDVYPWTAQALNGRPVEVLQTSSAVPIEQVAALKPELIVATTYYQLDQVRGQLEAIAPVVGPAAQVEKETWQRSTVRVGEGVGRANEARELVKDTEASLTSMRAAHPGWQGRTITFGPVIPGQELYTVNSASDASAALLTTLGLSLSPAVTQLPESEIPGRAKISRERLGLLDADVLMLIHFGGEDARADFDAQPLFQQIPAVRRGSYISLESDVALALAFPSVLNIPYAIQRVAPQLDAALKS